jgi:hypothetical protein
MLTVIEIAPPMEDQHFQARADIRNGMTSVGEVIQQNQLQKGVPQVKEIKTNKIDLKDISPEIVNA